MPVLAVPDRPLGVVYTPPEVAGAMVRLAIEPLVRGKSADEILAVRVCDPAIGAGAFLREVVSVLSEHLVAAWRGAPAERAASADLAPHARPPRDLARWEGEARQRVAAACIAGVDIDAPAVAEARAALGLDRGSEHRLRVDDALTLDWEAAYPDVFARGGFDVVVGNPPYIRQERLAWSGGSGKAALRRFATYDGVADLYVYFVELAHRVLRPGGAYCLIMPNKWLTAAYGRPLRTFLAAERSVRGLVDLGRAPLFADADAFPCIVWGTAGQPSDEPIRAARVADGTQLGDTLARTAGEPGYEHPRARWGAEPWHIETPSERALLDRLARAWPPLREVVPERPSRGVVTGLNRAFVIDRATRAQLLAREPAAAPLIRPFVKGRDIRRWLADDAERWILLVDRGTSLDDLPGLRAHLAGFREALEPRPRGHTGAWHGRKPGAYAWYELQDPVGPLVKARAPRLLYQDIQTAPACCLDFAGEVVPDTTVWMLPTDDRLLLAVLNSPLYAWYARRRFPPALNGAVRPKLAYLQALPIAQPATSLRREIEALVDRQLALVARQRAGDLDALPEARALDAAIADAVANAYALSSTERALVAAG